MDVEVSVVTGTYNRLLYLKIMVDSVRRSVGVGIPYEIVLVDGGSTDGTIEWCEQQPDVVLVKQGKLLGAVKAFNEGCRVARGRYIILANDDIEFIGLSITSALTFMHDNPLVGIGCFYQDRRASRYHVESMSAIVDGKPSTTYYGQVCIVPKWLGDYVGWWGDYLYTYGGDNELSCNVLELGYKVLPAPCTAIHDSIPMDDLRRINNQDMMEKGKHPDTEAWLAKWTRNGMLGPVVKPYPDDPVILKKPTRFFYLPIYERGHEIQKTTKRGLRDALARYGLVVEGDYVNDVDNVLDLACSVDADVIITQFHDANRSALVLFEALKEQHPEAIFVNWNGDFHPENLYDSSYMSLLKRYDHAGVITTSVADKYNKAGISWFYWQIGYEETPKKLPLKEFPKHDVVFLANGYSVDRIELATKLRLMKDLNVGLYGSWPAKLKADGNTLYDFVSGAALYRNAKIAIGDSQWPNATGFVSNRLFQSMSAGSFLLHQYFDGMEELLGLQNGVHLVTWVSWNDLLEKIRYYLKNPDERRIIADAGQKFVLKNHSFDVRVKELMRRINA